MKPIVKYKLSLIRLIIAFSVYTFFGQTTGIGNVFESGNSDFPGNDANPIEKELSAGNMTNLVLTPDAQEPPVNKPGFKYPRPLEFKTNLRNSATTTRGTTVYSEGFEPGGTQELPPGWTVKRNSAADGGLNGNNLVTATSEIWFRNYTDPQYVFSGSASMIIGYQAQDFTWAITPEINLPGDDEIELSFWMWYNFTDPTFFHITIFADNSWNTLESWVEGPSNLFEEQIIINLSAYSGNTVKLGFVYEHSNGYEMAIDEIQITAGTETFFTWTGNVSFDWENPDNWNNAVPGASGNVIIPENVVNFPLITGSVICNELLIAENATLAIATGGRLTVNGSLTNEAGVGGLQLESNSGQEPGASLVHSSAGVLATVERYLSGDALAWHQLSSPVAEQSITTGFFETGSRFLSWYEPVQTWVSFANNTVWPTWSVANGDGNFIPGKGYLTAYPAVPDKGNPAKIFEGILNQGVFGFEVTKQAHPSSAYIGYNLAGNPYPSAIDWDAATGWGRSALVNDGGYSYWVWNDDGSGNYGVYITGGTGTNGVSQYIAPMQGFWVEASVNGSLIMDNEVRTHSEQLWLKNEPAEILRLGVTSNANTYSDEVVFIFGKESNVGGAAKMFSMLPDAPGLYTPKNGKNYSISFLTTIDEHALVPVAFKPGVEALYTLSLKVHNDFNHTLLEDRKTGFLHNLSKFPEYTFSALPGDDEHRFVLHFKVLGADEIVDDKFHCFYHAGQLFVFNPWTHYMQIRLIDINGRLIREQSLNQQGMHNFGLSLPQGVYLVQIISETRTTKGKILVK